MARGRAGSLGVPDSGLPLAGTSTVCPRLFTILEHRDNSQLGGSCLQETVRGSSCPGGPVAEVKVTAWTSQEALPLCGPEPSPLC